MTTQEPGGDRPVALEQAAIREAVRARLFRAPAEPMRIGRFVLLRRIGVGGMGVVYAAYDEELDRKVAVKLLRASPTEHGSEGRRRLLREAQALAKLSHPNVVTVHEVGEHDDEIFIAMEFVEGTTLRKRWDDDRPRWRAVVDAMLQAGEGVAAAHRAGLVHRDFKPDNVIVGDDGRVRVLDFGLARAVEQPTDDLEITAHSPGSALETPLTAAGLLIGTPNYMAPEQHSRRPADARSDVYSFCVVLWEGLFGERPFVGDSIEELSRAVLAGQLRPPPRGKKAPPWVRAIAQRGLEVDPARRWSSMDELLAALRRDPAGRRRAVAVVGAIATLAIAIGGGVQLDRQRRRESCRDRADAIDEVWNEARSAELRDALGATGVAYAATTFDRAAPLVHAYVERWRTLYTTSCEASEVDSTTSSARWDAARSCLEDHRGALGSLLSHLWGSADANAVEGTVTAFAGLGRLDRCSDDDWLDHHAPGDWAETEPLRARLWQAAALAAVGDAAGGREIAAAAAAEAEHVDAQLHRSALARTAGYASEAGDYEGAAAMMRTAFDAALAAGDDQLALETATGLVYIVGYRLPRVEEASWWAEVAQALMQRLGGEATLVDADLSNNLGLLYGAQNRHDDAATAHRNALEIYEQLLGDAHPTVGRAHNGLGFAYDSAGRYDDALREYTKAAAIWEQALGPDHPRVAGVHVNLGVIHQTQGRLDEAEAEYRRALEVWERAHGPEHVKVANALNNIGGVYREQGRFDDAERVYLRALAIREKALGAEHPLVARAYNNLGPVHAEQGRHDDAVSSIERGLAIQVKVLGPEHQDVAGSWANLCAIRLGQERPDDAEPACRKALAIFTKAHGPDHPLVALAHRGLADVFRAQRRWGDAEREYGETLRLQLATFGEDHPDVARARAAIDAVRHAAAADPANLRRR